MISPDLTWGSGGGAASGDTFTWTLIELLDSSRVLPAKDGSPVSAREEGPILEDRPPVSLSKHDLSKREVRLLLSHELLLS